MNLANLDHPLASRPVDLVGEDVAIGGTVFRLRALSRRNLELMLYMVESGLRSLDVVAVMPHLPELLARASVLRWSHLSAGGVPIEYSPEAARELFRQHPMLAQEVFFAALSLADSGREGVAVADAKKPPHGGETTAASSGTSSAPPARASWSQH